MHSAYTEITDLVFCDYSAVKPVMVLEELGRANAVLKDCIPAQAKENG